jgi:hypothetical protein
MENEPAEMKAPRILCEVLVFGEESNKPKIKRMLDKMQKLIDKSKTNESKVRVLWYMDNGELSTQGKKDWLINKSNCVFYVFAPEDYKISDNYINNLMIGVNMFDRAIGVMKKEGIVMKKKTKQLDDEVEFEEIKSYPPLEILD